MMELAASGEWNLSGAWKTNPAARRRGCCTGGTLEQEPDPHPHPRAGAPSCGGAAAPAARGSRADHVPRRPRNKRRRKFPSQAVCERSEPGPGASVRARGGSSAQAGGHRIRSRPRRTLQGLRGVFYRGSRPLDPEGKGLLPAPRPDGEGRTGSLPPATTARLGLLGLLYSFLNWRKGAHRLPLAHSDSR